LPGTQRYKKHCEKDSENVEKGKERNERKEKGNHGVVFGMIADISGGESLVN